MERQNSITLLSITNFLESGALVRHREQWVLIEGPFTPASGANRDEITVFFPDFYDLSASLPVKGRQTYRLSTAELRQNCETYLAQISAAAAAPLAKAPWEEPTKELFAESLQLIQKRIAAGEIQKAVPVVFAKSQQTVTPRERAQMLLQLLEAPANLYVYGFWNQDRGVMGATPEVLFEYRQGVLRTMALAGTCPKSEAASRESLLDDAKEKQEHLLVVEDLKEIFKNIGAIKTQGPYVLELPSLYHLCTDIEIECTTAPNFLALLRTLHPTPALGVAPRKAGYQWMTQLQGQQGRGGFGAPFAFFGPEEALCLVAIRNLQWNDNLSMIGSGCGVVAASELEREWRELFQKRLSVRKILGLEL
ncbi:MAG: chorismate-binding protein [Bdellovibrio sp.]|nr:chorismate-binding protein [Bdellovibrio sp.]